MFEAIGDAVSDKLILPRDITLSIEECGFPNAFYFSESSQVRMCYELLFLFVQDFRTAGFEEEEAITQALYAFSFVSLHELGHAVIHDLNLPILGREEDVADQFATFMTTYEGVGGHAFAWAAALELMLAAEREDSREAYLDTHSSSPQRARSIVCLAYGSAPEEFFDIPEEVLPPSQRGTCVSDSRRMVESFERLLGPYRRS